MKPVQGKSGYEFTGAQLDSFSCLSNKAACPEWAVFLPPSGSRGCRGGSSPPWALGPGEFPRRQLPGSGFVQDLNVKFLYEKKNTVTEQLMNVNLQ